MMKYVLVIECVKDDDTKRVEFIEFDSLKKAIERAQAEYEYRQVVKELDEKWYITIYNDFEVNLNDDTRKAIINGDYNYIVDYDAIWHNGDFLGNILCCELNNDYDDGFEIRDNTILFNRINLAYEYMKNVMKSYNRFLALFDPFNGRVTYIQELADYEY